MEIKDCQVVYQRYSECLELTHDEVDRVKTFYLYFPLDNNQANKLDVIPGTAIRVKVERKY